MKSCKIHSLFLAFVLLMLTTACSNDTEQPTEGSATLNFRILNFQQVSLDEVTRATNAETLDHLDMAIYQAATHALVSNTQTAKGSENYGSFSATLPFGDYNIVFLGYNGSRTAQLTSPESIQFADFYVPDFFYKTLPLSVNASTNQEQNISLARAVAAFTIRGEGYIPTNTQDMTITAKGGGQVFNALTGKAAETADMTRSYNLSSKAGGTSFGINFYTFLPATESTMDFTVTAYDTKGGELAKRTFNDVSMKINQRSIFSGAFFGNGEAASAFNISLENPEWDDVEHTY